MRTKLVVLLCTTFLLLPLFSCTTVEPLSTQKDLHSALLGTWYVDSRCPPSQCLIFTPDSFCCYTFSDTFGFSDSLIHVNLKREVRGIWRILPGPVDPDIQYAFGKIELEDNTGYKESFTAAGDDTVFCFTKDLSACTLLRKDFWYFTVYKDFGHGLVINDTLQASSDNRPMITN